MKKSKNKKSQSYSNLDDPAVVNPIALAQVQVDYMTELETNSKYSLEVDPENKYNLSLKQKEFVKYYIDFRNVNTAADICGIDQDLAKQWFTSYAIQNEIRRINLALYQRQFASKILSVDQLGGYLSSLLTDQYVPLASQLSTGDKLRVVEMLLKLNDFKAKSIEDPAVIIEKDINDQIKDLSVDALKQLISQTEIDRDKNEIINSLDQDNALTAEEKAYLKTLSTAELLKLLNETSSHKGDSNE